MSGEVTITLKLPHRKLWPNNGNTATMKGRIGKWRHTKQARYDAKLLALAALKGERHTFTGYAMAFFFPDAIRRDDDNAEASCKAYRDGIADALCVDDHTIRKARLSTFQIDRKQPRVEITLIP